MPHCKLEHMPGPTDEARALQLKQCIALEALYDAWNEALAKFGHKNREAAGQDPDYLARKAEYEGSITELEALLGPDAHCNAVDTDLWSTYSDCYKSDVGFRPRWHRTRAQVQAYLAQPQEAATVV